MFVIFTERLATCQQQRRWRLSTIQNHNLMTAVTQTDPWSQLTTCPREHKKQTVRSLCRLLLQAVCQALNFRKRFLRKTKLEENWWNSWKHVQQFQRSRMKTSYFCSLSCLCCVVSHHSTRLRAKWLSWKCWATLSYQLRCWVVPQERHIVRHLLDRGKNRNARDRKCQLTYRKLRCAMILQRLRIPIILSCNLLQHVCRVGYVAHSLTNYVSACIVHIDVVCFIMRLTLCNLQHRV